MKEHFVDYPDTAAAAAADSIDNTVVAEQPAVRSMPSMQQFVLPHLLVVAPRLCCYCYSSLM